MTIAVEDYQNIAIRQLVKPVSELLTKDASNPKHCVFKSSIHRSINQEINRNRLLIAHRKGLASL